MFIWYLSYCYSLKSGKLLLLLRSELIIKNAKSLMEESSMSGYLNVVFWPLVQLTPVFVFGVWAISSLGLDLVIKHVHSCVWEYYPTLVRTFFYILISIRNRISLLFNRSACEVQYLISESARSVDDAPSLMFWSENSWNWVRTYRSYIIYWLTLCWYQLYSRVGVV